MIYRRLGNTDMVISSVTLGTLGMGAGGQDDSVSIETIHAALDAGVNIIDTAQPYGKGKAEHVVGEALKGRRNKVFIAAKCGNLHLEDGRRVKNAEPNDLRRQLGETLERLKTDYIDIYQMHWPVLSTPFEDSFGEMVKMRDEGWIRFIGVSNFTLDEIEEASKYAEIVSLQPLFSLVDRGAREKILPYCIEKGLGVMSYGSIGGGALTGKYKERPVFDPDDTRSRLYACFSEENWAQTKRIADRLGEIAAERGVPTVQVAINWVTAQKGMTSAIVGARNPEQAVMNVGAGEWSLNKSELSRIEDSCR